VSIEDKDRDDVMERLLELGGDKKYLTFDDLNRELPDNVVSPEDIEDVLQKLEGSNIPVADSDERLLEQAAATVTDEDEEALDEDIELDLSAGALEKTNDPVRLYLREMGVVPLLTREGEVAIAKRIERGQLKTQKAIARSPIAVREVLKIGEDLENGRINIRDTVTFSEQAELTGDTWEGTGLDLETTNGAVRLRVPEDYSARLETGTVNGGIDIDFPVTVTGRIGREFSTTLGGGGPLVRAETTNGQVRISRGRGDLNRLP